MQKDNYARRSERSKKERKTEEEMGRQHIIVSGMELGDLLMATEDREMLNYCHSGICGVQTTV